jgi:hypothetical protein
MAPDGKRFCPAGKRVIRYFGRLYNEKANGLTALDSIFSLTFALFTGAFAAGIGKYSAASTKSSILQTTESG